LQGYQKKSTFEPLRIINELINYANEENKELWFFLLDMSKAYDRVNTYMLKKAMRRIKIPEKLCNIIIGMFKEHTNQVFTPAGLTAPFDMLTGIDQREIISPLLWIIFYDLLLSNIRKTGLGFKISAKEYLDIYEGTYREKSLTFPGCGYMDDTSFLTSNKLDMERILKIADSFYMFNDIKINKSKSALLLRLKNKKHLAREINIKFGSEEINIQPVQHNKTERFLRVWINMYNKHQHIIQQIRNEVAVIVKSLTTKRGLTDKMMIYLFNYLVIPVTEYRSQLIVLDKKILEKLMASFRKVLKNKLKFARTAPNAILETNFIYNLTNFFSNQLQAKITNFILQINDKDTLGEIMDICMTNIQNLLLLENNPLYCIDTSTSYMIRMLYKNNFIMNNILIMKDYKFEIHIDKKIKKNFGIGGGPTTLRSLLTIETYVKNFKFLQEHNIRYIDQIISLSKKYLLSIKELEEKSFVKLNGKMKITSNIKNYGLIVKELTISPHTYKLKSGVCDRIENLDKVENMKGTVLLPIIANPKKDTPIMVEINFGENFEIAFGIIRKVIPGDILIATHMTALTTLDEKGMILEKCTGCHLNRKTMIPNVIFSNNEKSRCPCLILINAKEGFCISRNKGLNGIGHIYRIGCAKYIFPEISERILRENFSYNRMFSRNSHLYRTNYSKLHELIPEDKDDWIDDIIDRYLNNGKYAPTTQRIQRCRNRILDYNDSDLKIYIDGSVQNYGTENIESICGVMVYDAHNNLIDSVFSTVENWITANKAEVLAFMIALLIIPNNKTAKIYTDNLTICNNFEKILQQPHRTTLRDLLKFNNNNQIWTTIKDLMIKYSPQVEIIKIKAHADDYLHNALDKEIKERYSCIQQLNNVEVKLSNEEYRYPIASSGNFLGCRTAQK
jgi:ribonuclease HI